MDRVQVLKQESTALGGDDADGNVPYDQPIEPQEDAIEAAGVYLQDATNRDETTLISRSGLDMLFRDGNNPLDVTLTQLLESAAGGITDAQHRALRHLIHLAEAGGPQESVFGAALYMEVTGGPVTPTNVTWYEDNTKTKKIVENIVTWTGVKATTSKWIIYNTAGVAITPVLLDTINYTGINPVSIDRTFPAS